MATLVITGGHHNSALVFAELAKKNGDTVYWYGHRFASRDSRFESAEFVEVTAAGIPFFDLPAGRGSFSFSEIIRLPLGFLVALKLLLQHRPTHVVSFGGYLGLTTSLVSILLGIPVYLHEQTIVAGKANILVGYFAKRIYLTFPDSIKYFSQSKSLLVGLPLRQSIIQTKKTKIFARNLPTLLVLGGKQGAHVINTFIFANLSHLLKSYNIIHQTGNNSHTKDYEQALARKHDLEPNLAKAYLPHSYINQLEIGKYLGSVDTYLGRSGAHITYELAILALRSILIPLPQTHNAEQQKHAQYLEKNGIGIVIEQSELSFQAVDLALQKLATAKPKKQLLPLNAAEVMYHDLKKL